MKKQVFIMLLAVTAPLSAWAGGYLTNTNQNAAFGRNLSQEAMIDVMATYANPAGVAFLNPGWHFAFSNQSAFQTRTANSWFIHPEQGPFLTGTVNGVQNTSASKYYDGKATAPIIPSLDLAYVQDRWSVAFHFGVVGGGGKCEFEDGLGSFESKVAMLPSVLNALAGQNMVKGYSMETYMRGRQYYFGGQLNATYKLTDNLSVAAGLRTLYANSNYYGYVRNMRAVMADGTQKTIAEAMTPMTQQLMAVVPEMEPVMREIASVDGDVNLNCDQTGWGFTPILGIDWRINEQWNVAAKYEFKTRLRLENESGESASGSKLAQLDEYADGKTVEADIPGILTLGVQYSPISQLRLNLGGHIFFDKEATQYGAREKELHNQSWEALAGAEYDINDKITVSAGWQHTHYGLGKDSRYISDMSFVCNSNSVGLGARFHISKTVALDVSYFKTMYRHYDKHHDDYNNVHANFGNLMGQVQSSVAAIAQGIQQSGDPNTATKLAVIQSLNQKVGSLETVQTPGHDRLLRTNDVIGVAVSVDF